MRFGGDFPSPNHVSIEAIILNYTHIVIDYSAGNVLFICLRRPNMLGYFSAVFSARRVPDRNQACSGVGLSHYLVSQLLQR